MDPEDYVRNKRKLKKAVLEQYRYVLISELIFRISSFACRGLELLNDYRASNLVWLIQFIQY